MSEHEPLDVLIGVYLIPGLVTAQVLALTRRWILASTTVVVSAGLIPAMMWVPSSPFPIAGQRPVDRSLIA